MDVIKIFREFYSNEDTNMAIVNSVRTLCDLFEIDKAMLAVRNDIQQKFIKIIDYKQGEEVTIPSNNLDMVSQYSNINITGHTYIDVVEKNFVNLFDGKAHCYINDFADDTASVFKAINYDTNLENVAEILAHHTKFEDYFAYGIFEKQKGSKPFTDYQKEVIITLCDMIQDSMQKTEMTKLLYNERKVKETILNNENMPVCMVEKDSNNVIYFNELYKQIIPNIELNETFSELTDYKNRDLDCTIDCKQLEKNSAENGKYWIKKSVPFKLGNGMDIYLMYAKDIDDYVEQLEVMDLLTHSLSEKGLTEYYEREIKPNGKTYMLLSIDVDKFKHINNKYGMQIGDDILKQTAITLRNTIEDEEMFCRVNEDKFVVILKFDNIEDINDKFHKIKDNLNDMQKEHFTDIQLKFVGGVTIINKEIDFNVLIDQANTARKSIKGSVDDKFALYTDEVEKKVQKEFMIEQRMDTAVDNDEFLPFIQPKFDLKTMEICGAEALVRWITPNGVIYPDKFIPLFEKNGFIETLDFIIYEKVIKYMSSCIERNLPLYPISMNVSRVHIKNKQFMKKFMKIVEKYNVPVDLLELEITESAFIEDIEILKNFVNKIKSQNIKVSIDDFGSAYSSLQILKDIDMDILKIDRGFLENIGVNDEYKFTKDVFVLKNIMNLAKDLDCKIICEGVETEKQIEILKNIDCELGQGFVFAKPMSLEDYEKQFLTV